MPFCRWPRGHRGALLNIVGPALIGLFTLIPTAGALTAQSPDLVPTSVTGPSSAQIGQSIQATIVYGNQGTVTSTSTWQGRVYLSTDQTITTADIPVGSWTRNTDLTPGASDTHVGNFTVPGVTPGVYFLGTILDVNDAETESDETNNSLAAATSITITAAPAIGLNPATLTYAAQVGQDPPAQTVTVTNTGAGTLNWSGTVDQTWLGVSPTSGALAAGASQIVTVTVTSAALAAGPYAATITVSDPAASNTPQTVAVDLTVSATPAIGLNPTTLTYAAQTGQDPSPNTQTVTVTNTAGGTLNWTATENATWMSVSPPSGALTAGASQIVTVTVTSSALVAGSYSEPITVSDAAASNTPQTVTVDLTVTAGPAIGLSPTTLTFGSEVGSDPPTQTVTVSNTGGGTLNWSATLDQTWLGVSPASGALTAGASQVVTVTVTSAALAAGPYAATLTVSDPAASNTPQAVTVDLTVTATPAIGLTPTSLTYAAQVGSDPPTQTVTVTNTGNGTLDWSATDNQTWLSVSPSTGSLASGASQVVTVTVTSSSLAAGSYLATLTVGDPAAGNTPQTVSVDLTVTPLPAIGVVPPALSFGTQVGTSPPSQTITITNTGGGTLSWGTAVNQGWLSVSPTTGSLGPGLSQVVTVTVSSASLAGGSYAGTITISDTGASNSPQTVTVSLTVSSSPAIGVSPNTLTYAAQVGTDPPTQAVTVTNTGGGTLDWSATGNQTWLSVSPSTGSLASGASQVVTVTVTSASLAAGSYTAAIAISDPAASNTPQTVTVDLTVSALPAIGISPGTLSFGTQVGTNPPTRTVTVTNTGGGTLNWGAADNQPWLSVTPTTGSLTAGQSQTVTVTVISANLPAGNYAGTVTISDTGASNSPQAVVISLAVSSSAAIGVTPSTLTYSVGEGSSPASQALTITNLGGGTLNWQATANQTWLGLSPASGTRASGQSQAVTVSVNSSSLGAGSYAATITVMDPAASNSPQTVAVTLVVSASFSQPTVSEAANSLLGQSSLTPDVMVFLDSIGNQNGRYDVGDFRAYVQMLGLLASTIPGGS